MIVMSVNTDKIKMAQSLLAADGFYTDTIDGIWGPNSKQAFSNFCKVKMPSGSDCNACLTNEWDDSFLDLIKKYANQSQVKPSLSIGKIALYSLLGTGFSLLFSKILSRFSTKRRLSIGELVGDVIATYREPGFYKEDDYKGRIRYIPIDIIAILGNVVAYKMYGKLKRSEGGYGIYFSDCDRMMYKVLFGRDKAYYKDNEARQEVILKDGAIDYWKDLIKPCEEI